MYFDEIIKSNIIDLFLVWGSSYGFIEKSCCWNRQCSEILYNGRSKFGLIKSDIEDVVKDFHNIPIDVIIALNLFQWLVI